MLVLPLVICSIIVGITSLGDVKQTGKLGLRTLLYYFGTTFLAAILGMVWVNVIKPGGFGTFIADPSVEEPMESIEVLTPLDSILQLVLNMFPDNLVKAAAELNILGLIVFS